MKIVIIGAGPAGFRAAEVLRQQSSKVEITLVGDEAHPPYNRPPLSKEFLTKGLAHEKLHLQPLSFYETQRITLRLGKIATRIDRAQKQVELADGTRLSYDKLLLTMGCRGRRLPPALAKAQVHCLRGLADAFAIRAELGPGRDLVLIGGGFVGLELAAAAAILGGRVTVLEAMPRLMTRTMPSAVGEFARRLHEGHGVRFEFDARLKSIEPRPGGGVMVATERGTYHGDVVVAGIGAQPNTELAAAAGLAVEDGIVVDAQGRSSDPDIFAAGDVTRHLNPLLGRAIRVESWQVALNQAAAVAHAMLGATEEYSELPWLWTDQYDSNIQVLGLPTPELELITRGDPNSNSFTMLGLDGEGRLACAITVNSGRDMSALRRLAATRVRLPEEALADPQKKLSDLARAALKPS
ncbi:MAG TPA: FAD-dependent oxidoreductase [Stellaceae bacterium]|nr:FAD-dependent oxidoreductase [Stellaceae bacterium]